MANSEIRKGSLCSGYGGLDMALPGTLAYVAEMEPNVSRVLKREHPEVPNLGDITTGSFPPVDLLAAGFPCQPVSAAGRQQAELDVRWLWPHVLRHIQEGRPVEVFLENVQNIRSIQGGAVLRGILSDLRAASYAARWTVLGACAVGAPHHRHRWFLRATRTAAPGEAVQITTKCGAPRNAGRILLPTPVTRDGDGREEGDEKYWDKRAQSRSNGMPLGAVVNLLPTPTTRDGMGGAGTSPMREGGMNLRTAVTLLPTPRATDGVNGGPNQRGSSGDLAMGSACQEEHWGKFAQAVALWEEITGRPAPAPTVLAPRGGRRLNPELSEWMMGLPLGFLTGELDRSSALRAAGNGVVPLQAATAWELLA